MIRKIIARHSSRRRLTLIAIPALLTVVLAGCAGNDEEIAAAPSIPITGDHIDEFGSVHEISRTTWINGSVFGTSDYRPEDQPAASVLQPRPGCVGTH